MRKILINGNAVSISVETYQRLKAVARREKISIGKAVQFCLERVI